MGGTERDMYDHNAYKQRFEALERERTEELAAFPSVHHAGSS
jgi:hypothetical protein